MRLSNTLVMACAVVFLASGHALSETTNADQVTVSKLEPLELGASIDAVTSENKKRSLRSHRAMDEDDDEEERYNYLKFRDLQQGKWNAIFSKWRGKGRSPTQIDKKLKKLAGLSADQRSTIVTNYKLF